ncbi:MAG: DNA mismatch repair endonuclease MutL [Bacteroidetes bacterium]|nr:DNA mismatch repair endonuclease MutL [Bacteroidota bacterium]
MPDIIRLLPESIANQIAAGEVVQRPASVVKELLENSLDAGATSITLIFKDGGQTLIQVIDNGKGMSDTDARMCWERHATSKIKEAQDLFALSTYGFRGEALASIASVSQVELKTRSDEDSLGNRIVIEAGEVKKQEPVQFNRGTSISVKNLFFNIPVRRNFLKSITVESRYIIEEFQRCALARPDVEMILVNGNSEVYKLEPTDLRQRIEDVLAKSKSGKLISIEEDTEIVKLHGFVGSPERARKTRGDQYLFVNGRYIRDAYFHHAISQPFDGLIESDFHPMYVIFMEMDPARIDVNVHPTKTEVKFEDGRHIYAIIKSVVQKALSKYHQTPVIETIPGIFQTESFVNRLPDTGKVFSNNPTPVSPGYSPFEQNRKREKQPTHWERLYEPFRDNPAPEFQSREEPKPLIQKEDVRIGKSFQFNYTYLAAEINGSLYLVHQQRAHERVLYEKYLGQLKQGKTPSQQLLFPRTIELPAADYHLIMDLSDELEQLGFDISSFGKNTVIVNGTPADIKKGEEREMLEGILDSFKMNEQSLHLDKRENLARALARNACMPNKSPLSEESINSLLQSLFQCNHPGHTPSGRVVLNAFEPEQLEAMFKKSGS